MMEIKIKQPYCCNEIGGRDNSEDSIYPRVGMADESNRLFIVCDGVGGCDRGEVASESVSESFADYWLLNSHELDSEQKVNNALIYSIENLQSIDSKIEVKNKMGTTLTLASIGSSSILLAHIGDSRIYQIRPGEGIIFQTKDHSLVQTWIDAGLLTADQAKTHPKRNVITRAIHPDEDDTIYADVVILTDIKDGDYLFMCTDGVLESVEDSRLLDIVESSPSDQDIMSQIVSLCQDSSKDNFSAYLIPLSVEGAIESVDIDESQVEESSDFNESDIAMRVEQRRRNRLEIRDVEVKDVEVAATPVALEKSSDDDSWFRGVITKIKSPFRRK